MYTDHKGVVNFKELPDPRDTWDLIERIGEGTYGEVHSARHKLTGEVVAAKILENVQEVIEEIEEEYIVLRDLSNHPNMPKFFGLFLQRDPQLEDQLWITLEFCSGGSVTDLVKANLEKGLKMKETIIGHILNETLKALQHLHGNHVIHRDVKGHNILLTADAGIKLVDFGVSGHWQGTSGRRNTSVGTPFWMAPEVIACEQQFDYDYDCRCDIWSLGVTAIELADGEPPLADEHPMRALFKIPRSPPPTMQNPNNWSAKFRDFISNCVIKDFEKRPFVEQLQTHPFVVDVPKDTKPMTKQLLDMMSDIDLVIHEPYITTKHGQLRSRHPDPNSQPISFVDDLATLEHLEEDVIVRQLWQRYNQGVIYTYIGDILLAVNPFSPLTIYDEEYSKRYRNVCKADNSPHIFAVADQSYQYMMHNKHNQCVVISGESGAGKTESANFLVQQLTLLGRAPNRKLEDRILQVNPLVEAFGNAKTVINDNSSRFGKYLEMIFTSSGKVMGARLSDYLLEKSRVIHQAEAESNFHIFYHIKDGLSQEDKLNIYHLNDNQIHRYLNQEGGAGLPSTSFNRAKFKTIHRCFEMIGFKQQEINSVYAILAAILHIGNIDFVEKESRHHTGSALANSDLLQIVSTLLGLEGRELKEALLTSGMVARGETIIRNNTVNEAVNIRDALAKGMYGRLFSWIVNKINHLLKPSRTTDDLDDRFTIGILDIFGFENFRSNSFEQLCINIANEQIQYYFNEHIFAWEQQEYMNEDVDVERINFVDNRPVLDMFLAKPVGLLALLDEESNFPKGTDRSLVEKFQRNLRCRYFSRPPSSNLLFTVQHYAGKIEYDASGFLEKNRDRLAAEMMQVLRLSQLAIVRTLFNCPIGKTGNLSNGSLSSSSCSVISSPSNSIGSTVSVRSASNSSSGIIPGTQSRTQQTVATYFRYSLMDLLSKMVAGTPHFVRCIRPNEENSPGFFDDQKVLKQLRYTGVLETTRIRRQGYSHRITFSEFFKRYYILGYNYSDRMRVNKDSCRQLLQRIGLTNWILGKTKVFLKYYHIEQLSRKFEEQQRRIVLVQAVIRTWIQRRKFHKLRHAMNCSTITIQRAVRGFLVKKKYGPVLQRRRYAILLIQAATRGFIVRRRTRQIWEEKNRNSIKIQSAYRGYRARKRVRSIRENQDQQRNNAATVLQKYFRMWTAQACLVRMQMQGRKEEEQRKLFSQQVAMSSQRTHQTMMDTSPGRRPAMAVTSPSLSEDRKEHMKKTQELKSPLAQQQQQYYKDVNSSVKQQDTTWARNREKLKQINSPEGNAYYSSIARDLPKTDQEREKEIEQEKADLDEMFRSVLAASAACKFLENKAMLPEAIERLKEIVDRDENMSWDAVLQEARQRALATELVPCFCTTTSADPYYVSFPLGLYDDLSTESANDSSHPYYPSSGTPSGSSYYETPSSWTYEPAGETPYTQFTWRANTLDTILNPSGYEYCNHSTHYYTNHCTHSYTNPPQIFREVPVFPFYNFGDNRNFSSTKSTPLIKSNYGSYQDMAKFQMALLQKSLPELLTKRVYGRESFQKLRPPPCYYFYPPTPPRPKTPTYVNITIPAPPAEPPPCPPCISHDYANALLSGNRGLKRVRFSAYDEYIPRKASVTSSSNDSDNMEGKKTLEDKELVKKDELLHEHQSQRENYIQNLEIQNKSSLQARYHKEKSIAQHQDNRQNRWQKHIEETSRSPNGEKFVIKDVLSPTTKTADSSRTRPSQVSVNTQQSRQSKMASSKALSTEEKRSAVKQDRCQPSRQNSTASKMPAKVMHGTQQQHNPQGLFDFRAMLRKTTFDPRRTLRRVKSDDETPQQVDFRSVLKKKTATEEQTANQQPLVHNYS